jgi:type IV secretion system protein VirD4
MPGIWSTNQGIYLGFAARNIQGPPPPLRDPLRYADDRHVVLVGPDRTGKTKRLLLKNLYDLTAWSAILNDIRGDLCRMTEDHRRRAGNIIIKLNPFDVLQMGSDGFNAVQALELTDEFPDDALQLAEAIIRIEGKEPHWSHAAQELVAALIMYVRLVIPDGSLADVRALLGQSDLGIKAMVLGGGNVDPRQLDLFQGDKESVPKGYVPPFRYEGKLYPGIIAAARIHKWPEMAVKAARFGDITPENRELHSVISTALTQTRWLDSRRVKADLAKNPFDFSVMKDRPVTVYLILPARRFATHSSWLRLVITSIILKLMQDGRKSRVPILLAFDEYAALAGGSGSGADDVADGFPAVARNMPMMAGYSIKLLTIWQDLAQAERIYGKSFESFLGNAGILQFFAPQDITTSEYISKRSGQRTVSLPSQGETLSPNSAMPGGTQWSESQNLSYIPMPLMLGQDARAMGPGYTVIFTHLEPRGPVRSYLPWPGDLPELRAITALDPS